MEELGCAQCLNYFRLKIKPPEGRSNYDATGHKRYRCKGFWKHKNTASLDIGNTQYWHRFQTYLRTDFMSGIFENCLGCEKDPISISEQSNMVDARDEETPTAKSTKTKRLPTSTVRVEKDGHVYSVKDVPEGFDLYDTVKYDMVYRPTHIWLANKNYKLKFNEKKWNQLFQAQKWSSSVHAMFFFTAVASICPSLSLDGYSIMLPLLFVAMLSKTHSVQHLDMGLLSKSFPSHTILRRQLTERAAQIICCVSRKLRFVKYIYTACDKGCKKGVSHFVKILSWWDSESRRVQTFTLDVDASEGSSQACASAIQYSLQKVWIIAHFFLAGVSSDSCGGGVLESLVECLHNLGCMTNNYLVACCTLHAIQLTLANGMKQAFGEGGTEKQNIMQCLHCAWDQQNTMEFEEFQDLFDKAKEHVEGFLQDNPNYQQFEPTKSFDNEEFIDRFKRVACFRKWDIETFSGSSRVPKAVLTRWYHVGMSAEYVWSNYLVLLVLTQYTINCFASNSKPHKIASGWHAMLQQEEIYTDLCFIVAFHRAFLAPHFTFLQDVDEYSKRASFRSHHIFSRYFLMDKDLRKIISDHETQDSHFQMHRDSLTSLSSTQKETMKKKSAIFFQESLDALHRHFQRWANTNLLPAALLGEFGTARIVAEKLLNIPFDSQKHPTILNSSVHIRKSNNTEVPITIETETFVTFVDLRCTDLPTIDCPVDPVFVAATALSKGKNIFHGPETELSVEEKNAKSEMELKYLPLASNTQHVESGVQSCNLVASTGRFEPLRSSMEIIRGYWDSKYKRSKMKNNPDKSRSYIEDIEHQFREFSNLQQELGIAPLNGKLEQVVALLESKHFKKQRLASKKERRDELLSKPDKKINKRQNERNPTYTAIVMDQRQYGRLRKAQHSQELDTELDFRMPAWRQLRKTNSKGKKMKLGWTEKMNLLKEDEKARRGEDEDFHQGFFRPLSTTRFYIPPTET